MLRDEPIRNVRGDLRRRWMTDDYFDLIVWLEADETIHGFQLCYDKPHKEHALTWTRAEGFSHHGVDTGENSPEANQTPILTAGGPFPATLVQEEFRKRSAELSPEIRDLVLGTMAEYEKHTGFSENNAV